MSKRRLPTWEEARQAEKAGNATPVESFVAGWEPVGEDDQTAFRTDLQDLINYVEDSK